MKSNIKILIILLIINFQFAINNYAQVAINNDNSTADGSAILDVKSTTKGVLVPRMTSAQRNMITNAAVGLLVFDLTTESFWFNGSSGWIELSDGNLNTVQDSDNDTKIQVEETPDEDVIRFDVGGTETMYLAGGVLAFENTGNSVFIGKNAGANDNQSIGSNNVSLGEDALNMNVAGTHSVAIGKGTMQNNLDTNNTTVGAVALSSNTTGQNNTTLGSASLTLNTTGSDNVALGYSSGLFR